MSSLLVSCGRQDNSEAGLTHHCALVAASEIPWVVVARVEGRVPTEDHSRGTATAGLCVYSSTARRSTIIASWLNSLATVCTGLDEIGRLRRTVQSPVVALSQHSCPAWLKV
jgi:hypothetical protein